MYLQLNKLQNKPQRLNRMFLSTLSIFCFLVSESFWHMHSSSQQTYIKLFLCYLITSLSTKPILHFHLCQCIHIKLATNVLSNISADFYFLFEYPSPVYRNTCVFYMVDTQHQDYYVNRLCLLKSM